MFDCCTIMSNPLTTQSVWFFCFLLQELTGQWLSWGGLEGREETSQSHTQGYLTFSGDRVLVKIRQTPVPWKSQDLLHVFLSPLLRVFYFWPSHSQVRLLTRWKRTSLCPTHNSLQWERQAGERIRVSRDGGDTPSQEDLTDTWQPPRDFSSAVTRSKF